MKKSLFVLFAFAVLLGGAAQAQYFSYGAKLGLGFPGFQDERIASERITPTLSVISNLNVTRNFLVQIELGYERKGNKYTNQEWNDAGELIESSVYDVKTNLDYITIPLLLKYNLGNRSRFYGQLGAYYGYLFHASFTGMKNEQMVEKDPIRSGLSPHDYGVLVGGGLETKTEQRGLSMLLDVKYNYGLKNLNVDPEVLGYDSALKNKSFIMSMGVIINIE